MPRAGDPALRVAFVLSLGIVSVSSASALGRSWSERLNLLESRRDTIVSALEESHASLLVLAAGNTALEQRLTPEPPVARPSGYGVLPDILADAGEQSVPLRCTRYSLQTLQADSAGLSASALRLRRHAARGRRPLAGLVTTYESLTGRLENFESHLSYHAYWQQAVVDWKDWFEERNDIAKDVYRLRALLAVDEHGEEAGVLRSSLLAKLAPFRPPNGLSLVEGPAGESRVAVTVLTDIADESSRASVREAVEQVFNQSAAARGLPFSLAIELRHVEPAELRVGEEPSMGVVFDAESYVRRFPPGSLVLTTGAASTHAFVGRYIQLGSAPLTRRTLAHEFAHLFGFNDAYLRGFEGNPDSGRGVILIEWTGLADDLMGSSTHGPVTEAMLARLLDAARRTD